MLANADVNCHWPGAVLSQNSDMPCYFCAWRTATTMPGHYGTSPTRRRGNIISCGTRLLARRCPDTRVSLVFGLRGEISAGLGEKVPWHKDLIHAWGHRIAWTNGNVWLVVEGVEPDKMAPQGLGFWTPLLGAALARPPYRSDARQRPVPTEKAHRPMWLQFTNETGQNRRRVFLVGKDDQGQMHRPRIDRGQL